MLYYVREGGGYEPFHEIEVGAVPPEDAGRHLQHRPLHPHPHATLGPWQEGAIPAPSQRLAPRPGHEADADIGGVDYGGCAQRQLCRLVRLQAAPSGGYVPPRGEPVPPRTRYGRGRRRIHAFQRWTMKDWGVLTACFGADPPVTPGPAPPPRHRQRPGPGGGHLAPTRHRGEDRAIAQINVAPETTPRIRYDLPNE